MGSFLAAGITDGSALLREVEEATGGLCAGSGCGETGVTAPAAPPGPAPRSFLLTFSPGSRVLTQGQYLTGSHSLRGNKAPLRSAPRRNQGLQSPLGCPSRSAERCLSSGKVAVASSKAQRPLKKPRQRILAHQLLAIWATKHPQFRHLQKSGTWFSSESPVLRCQWKHPSKGKTGTEAWPLVPLPGQDMWWDKGWSYAFRALEGISLSREASSTPCPSLVVGA